MTRENARIKVEQLDNYLSHTCQDYGERDHEAMMMAIKALEQLPKLQNRCFALSQGQLCMFCPHDCENRTTAKREVEE